MKADKSLLSKRNFSSGIVGMVIDDKKQKVIHSRYPTNKKSDQVPTKSNIGDINLRSNVNIEREQIMDRNNYYNNN